ncbi:MAG TPA: nucleotidyltransferase family protein [Aeromicrobium sp.]|nr:nucleotidyltransferase family protein [Aeromicrobium sp.]
MRRAIVLAGGLGTRLRAATGDLPKPLVKVAGRPLVAHQIGRLAGAGITDIVIATGYGADQVEAELGTGATWGAALRFSKEDSPRGTAGALALAAKGRVSADDTVVVVNGDLLSRHDLAGQLAAFESAGADASIHVREVADPRAYGVVLVGGSRVTGFLEKPENPPSNLVNAGTYVFRGRVLLDLPDTIGLSIERDVFPQLAQYGEVIAYRDDAPFLDVGTPEALAAAESWFE